MVLSVSQCATTLRWTITKETEVCVYSLISTAKTLSPPSVLAQERGGGREGSGQAARALLLGQGVDQQSRDPLHWGSESWYRGGACSSLFAHTPPESWLSHFQLISILRKCIAEQGSPLEELEVHSFGIRAAILASKCSFSSEKIMVIGHCHSSAYKLYVHQGLMY